MTLAENIATLRTTQGLSQEEVAQRVGVSRQSVSKWETGTSVPDLDKLLALSALFSLSLDQLVGQEQVAVTSTPTAPVPPVALSQRKTLGWILLAVGIAAVIFGLVLNILLVFLGGYLLFCGLICLSPLRHWALVIGWATFFPFFLMGTTVFGFMSTSMSMIFHPAFYQQALFSSLIVSVAMWVVYLLLVGGTVACTRLRRHPWLATGWFFYVQVWRFAFSLLNWGQVTNYYRLLGTLSALLGITLISLTIKAVMNWRKNQGK